MQVKCAHTRIANVMDLVPHPGNENFHPEKQIEVLAKIIAKNGQRSPIVVSKLSGFISKGCGRLLAIKLLGWETCAVDDQDYDSELDELNDRIADNEISRYAEFKSDQMLDNLKELDLDIASIDLEEFGLIDFELPQVEVETEPKEEPEEKLKCDKCGQIVKDKD